MAEHRRITGRRADLTRVRGRGSLRRVLIDGSGIASLQGIEEMTGLEQLMMMGLLSPLIRERLPRIRGILPLDGQIAPLGKILHDPDSKPGPRYSVGIDLDDERRGNPEAEADLRARLAAEKPELLARPRFDTESSAVWVLSDRRSDLERVMQLAASPRRGSAASSTPPGASP